MNNSSKFVSWNIKGLNGPIKRKRTFTLLSKLNCDFICLQETKIRSDDVKYLKNIRLGKEFVAASNKRKKGVVLYVKEKFNPLEVLRDPKGHYVGVNTSWNGINLTVIGIYAPNDNKGKFYKTLLERLTEINIDSLVMMGDFNGVINPKIDRFSIKGIKSNQGKLPNEFFDIIDHYNLFDVWRNNYADNKNYTFYSARHKSWARLDMYLISKDIGHKVKNVEIGARLWSDHCLVIIIIIIKCI